ncbi:NUDIX domain-containing protein [Stratiformator vulcanicus]|uniref:Nudix hydrolase domain-containing protein n=1 Tax=Stratiformator vulcanicus TaxID=2527980 RepID=A0A517QZ76_9PLAN|nr:NUDIX domain-containing protein [Stratiformator vulcanicus]QDT36903.1 hypothetical protein Pan189_12670 [Stratiformator vulcanicus]
MRTSTAALALITNSSPQGPQFLTQWNEGWEGLRLIGGHLGSGESFHECVLRKTCEELQLCETDLNIAPRPVAHLNFQQFSERARVVTKYRFEMYDVSPRDRDQLVAIAARPENEWVTEEEIGRGQTRNGRPISRTVRLLLEKSGRIEAERDPEVLTIGVTGHRNLEPQDYSETRLAVNLAFDDAEELAQGRKIEVLSPLAEGADKLVAEAALQRGYVLKAPLPLPLEFYETDFDGRALDSFRHLLKQAREWYSLPLPGDVHLNDLHTHGPDRNRMYAAVGEHVVDRCDILFALWDGRESGQTGGTDDTLKYALRERIGTEPLGVKHIRVERAGGT